MCSYLNFDNLICNNQISDQGTKYVIEYLGWALGWALIGCANPNHVVHNDLNILGWTN